MTIGTKSVLFGAHCFAIHPWFVAMAWWRLFGFPSDMRLWVAFFVHDLGYWGKPNMDGSEGEAHVLFGSRLMARLFGADWGDFCLFHSRFWAEQSGRPVSRLAVADKLAVCFEPWWLYLPRVILSGEIHEYMAHSRSGKYESLDLPMVSIRAWHSGMCMYLRSWVEQKDGWQGAWIPGPNSPSSRE